MKLAPSGSLRIGHANIRIADILSSCPSMFMGNDVLVAALGGGQDDLEKSVNWSRLGVEVQKVGDAVLVRSRDVPDVLGPEGILTQTDELYVVPAGWNGEPVEFGTFRPWSWPFDEGAPPEFIAGFERIGALRFFVDGYGLNFCVRTPEDERCIEQCEMKHGAPPIHDGELED